jgi:APA family basic amino acid/polyamine antiporter
VFIIFLNDLLGGTLSATQVQLLTAATIVAVTLLTLASMHTNGLVAAVVTARKVLLIAGIGVAAFLFSDGSWAHFTANGAAGACEGVSAGARLGITGFGAAIIGALWSYNGWATASFVAEEVREPLVNAGYFYALSPLAIANLHEAPSVAGSVMVRLLGASGASFLTLGMMLSTFGALHSLSITVARVPFAMASDGLLPHTFTTISPRSRVPAHAVLLLGACAVGFAFSGAFDVLTDLIVFMLLLFNGLGGGLRLRFASHAARRRAALSGVGLSCGARSFPDCHRLPDDQHTDRDAGTSARRTWHRCARIASLRVLRAAFAAQSP